MSFAAIHLPEFPTLAWLRADKQAQAQAAAVVEGAAPLECVVSMNRAARQLGLEHGMSRVQADTFGPVLFHARSLAEEQAALEELFAVAESFSPRVQMVASPVNGYGGATQLAAVLLLDRQGTEALFGEARQFARKLQEALLAAAFPANVAVAPNAEASLLLARGYTGVMGADAGDVESRLAPLPLSALPCEAATLETLRRWGIRNLGELAALPEAALVSRIGQQGKRLQRLARGTEEHLLVPEEPDFVLLEHAGLDAPLDSLHSLLFLISPMLERLLRQAVNHAYALRSVTVKLDLERADHVVEVRPAVPSQSRDLLLRLLHLKLQAEPPQAGVLGIAVSAVPAAPQVAQRGLFQAQFPDPGRLDLLLARLKSIAGEPNVGCPKLTNSHRDDEFLLAAFAPAAGSLDMPARPGAPRSALRRFRPPQPVRVLLCGAQPSILFWKAQRVQLQSASGPWQTSGYWWDGRRWEADEWDVITVHPLQALRLRHEPEPDAWYVAGLHD